MLRISPDEQEEQDRESKFQWEKVTLNDFYNIPRLNATA